MGIVQGVRNYYSLFGAKGLVLVTKARVAQRPIEVRLTSAGIRHPLYLRLRTSDVELFAEIMLNGEYDFVPVSSPTVIIDAGANIGLTSVFYANRFPKAKIISLEPEDSNFEMLKKNVAMYSNVVPLRAALWKENMQLTIYDPGLDHHGFRTESTNMCGDWKTRGLVPSITVDKIMSDLSLNYIDLLKIDIEGAEKEVFDHSSPWIDKIGTMAVELHDRFKVGCSESVHGAARKFGLKLKIGETTFFAREEYRDTFIQKQTASPASLESLCASMRRSLPVKIEAVAHGVAD